MRHDGGTIGWSARSLPGSCTAAGRIFLGRKTCQSQIRATGLNRDRGRRGAPSHNGAHHSPAPSRNGAHHSPAPSRNGARRSIRGSRGAPRLIRAGWPAARRSMASPDTSLPRNPESCPSGR